MSTKYQTKVRQIGVYTLGANLTAGVEQRIDIGTLIPPFIDVGKKSIITKITAKVTAAFATGGSVPALPCRYFRYLLDMRLVGPGNYPIVDVGNRGWMSWHWTNLIRGFVDEVRGTDFPANTASGTRTWTQSLDFEEPQSQFPLQRCYAVESFKAGNSGLYINLRAAATIKSCVFTVSSATVTLYAHVLDVPAKLTPIPSLVTRFAVQSNSGEIAPSPGPGKYLRIVMANSPVPGDNLDGTSLDDLSAYTQIDSFGSGAQKYSVFQEPVERLLDRVNRAITVERPSPQASPAGNSSLYRPYDPNLNSDGLTLGIPLVVPSRGTNFVKAAPSFPDFPRLHANSDIRTGLPGGFYFLCERVDARTAAVLNAYVGALTGGNGQSVLGRQAKSADAGDPSRAPMIIDCS